MLCLRPLKNHRYSVVFEYKYKDVTVPKGYITNGADIPRVFWWVFPPNMSDIMEAVVVHDYLCDQSEYTKADEYFKELLEASGISIISIFILHKSVVGYHFFRYTVLEKAKKAYTINKKT